jgi:hypothetical protein
MFGQVKWGPLALALILSVAMIAQADAGRKSGKGGKGGRVKSAKVEGTLTSVSVGQATIRRRNGAEVTVIVTSDTKVELNDVEVPLTSLPIGSRAQALYDAATFIATKLEAST